MMRTSEELDQLAAALTKAQSEFPTIAKTKVAKAGSSFTYRYAALPDLLRAVQPVLTVNGLSIMAMPDRTEDGRPALTTRLMHSSGQWIEATAELHLANETPQGHGSAITYARRYGLTGVLNIAADEDDDAVAAQGGEAPPRTDHTRSLRESRAVSELQLKKIGALFGELGIRDRAERLAYTSAVANREVTTSKELTSREASKLIDVLEQDVARKAG